MKKIISGVVLVLFAVTLTACGPWNEKDEFIDATVEATCLVFQSDNIFDPALEEDAKNIYKDHGFDADNDEYMAGLRDKYQDDPDVQAAIIGALTDCGGDIMAGFENAFEDSLTEGLDGATVEGEAVVPAEGEAEAVVE